MKKAENKGAVFLEFLRNSFTYERRGRVIFSEEEFKIFHKKNIDTLWNEVKGNDIEKISDIKKCLVKTFFPGHCTAMYDSCISEILGKDALEDLHDKNGVKNIQQIVKKTLLEFDPEIYSRNYGSNNEEKKEGITNFKVINEKSATVLPDELIVKIGEKLGLTPKTTTSSSTSSSLASKNNGKEK